MRLSSMLGILVRDEAAKRKLRQQVGEIGLVLYVRIISQASGHWLMVPRTLYESKGLEFDDVRTMSLRLFGLCYN